MQYHLKEITLIKTQNYRMNTDKVGVQLIIAVHIVHNANAIGSLGQVTNDEAA